MSPRIADMLRVECPVFYVDNVAEYWNQNRGGFGVKDIPTLMLPFPRVWLEYRLWRMTPPQGGTASDSVHVNAVEMIAEPSDAGTLIKMTPWWLHREAFYEDDGRGGATMRYGRESPGSMPEWRLLLDKDGAPIGGVDDSPSLECHTDLVTLPFLLAVAFLNCNNVRRTEHVPAGKFERARRRRGEPPSLKFYTLEIDPMKKVLRTEGRSSEVGLGKALHICRGHFVNYDGAGMFGKYKGRFWRESHVRGHLDRGAVVKDYTVKAPKADQ